MSHAIWRRRPVDGLIPVTVTLTLFDHLLVFVLAAWVPIQGALFYRRLMRAVLSGVPGARMQAYRRTVIREWSLVGVMLVVWFGAGRSPWDLGLGLSFGWGALVGIAATAAACLFLVRQMAMVEHDEMARDQIRETMQHLQPLVPANRREMRRFVVLSITAGVCEELLYRGFLLWYLGQITIMPVAVLTAALIFGVGHVYQGGKGIVRTGIFGLVATGLYLLTESLWAPMVLHAVLDITSGNLLRNVLNPRDPDDLEEN